jgi:PAS domain S-box-containing protein
MMINSETANLVVQTAVDAIHGRCESFHEVLDDIPAAIYVTDVEGTITYFNKACVELAGRTPTLGADKWCVTWRIFTIDGEFMPHDQCPMAVAIKEKREVRDVEAIAQRPDGTRIHFVPYPTPLFDEDGNFAGAVNLLLDVTRQRKPEYLREQAQRCRRLASSMFDRDLVETLQLMAAKYDEQSLKFERGGEAAA